METILKDLGLARYSERLRDKNINLQSFKRIVNSKVNAQQLRELVMQDCGLTSGQVLAICDRVHEQIINEENLFMSYTASKAMPLTPPSNYGKSANSKRISQLLKQPTNQMSKSPNISTQRTAPTQNQNKQTNSIGFSLKPNVTTNNNALMSNQTTMIQSKQQAVGQLNKDPLVKTLFKESNTDVKDQQIDQNDISSEASQEYIKYKLEEHRQSQKQKEVTSEDMRINVIPTEIKVADNPQIEVTVVRELENHHTKIQEKIETHDAKIQEQVSIQSQDIQMKQEQTKLIASPQKSQSAISSKSQNTPVKSPLQNQLSNHSREVSPLNQSPIRSCFGKKEPSQYSVSQQNQINQHWAIQKDSESEEQSEMEDFHEEQELQQQQQQEEDSQSSQKYYSSEDEIDTQKKALLNQQNYWTSRESQVQSISQNAQTAQTKPAYTSIFSNNQVQSNPIHPQSQQYNNVDMFKPNETDEEEDESNSDTSSDNEQTVEPTAKIQHQVAEMHSPENSFNQLWVEQQQNAHHKVEQYIVQQQQQEMSESEKEDVTMEEPSLQVERIQEAKVIIEYVDIGVQCDSLLMLEVSQQTIQKSFKNEEVQVELIKQTQVIIEDNNMKITYPQATIEVQQIENKSQTKSQSRDLSTESRKSESNIIYKPQPIKLQSPEVKSFQPMSGQIKHSFSQNFSKIVPSQQPATIIDSSTQHEQEAQIKSEPIVQKVDEIEEVKVEVKVQQDEDEGPLISNKPKTALIDEEEPPKKATKKRVRFNVIDMSEDEQHNSAKKLKKNEMDNDISHKLDKRRKRLKINYQEEKCIESLSDEGVEEEDQSHAEADDENEEKIQKRKAKKNKKEQKSHKIQHSREDHPYKAVAGFLSSNCTNQKLKNNIMSILFSGKK